ncbi:MAG: OmpA family protein [Acidobacteriota bacterium]
MKNTILVLLAVIFFGAASQGRVMQTPSKPKNPCNPCAKNPCNPCAKNPCNPCAKNPCNPCSKDKNTQELEDAILRALARRYGESSQETERKKQLLDEVGQRLEEDARAAVGNDSLGLKRVEVGDEPDPDISSVLVVGRLVLPDGSANPLLEGDCRDRAVERSFAYWRAYSGSDEGFDEHRELWKKKIISQEGVNYAEYLGHIAECKGLCRPFIAEIVDCHVLSVSRLQHSLVLFGYNSDRVEAHEESVIEDIARSLTEGPELKALLIGRASKLTQTGNADYNRNLAARRALSVQDRLGGYGVDAGRTNFLPIGWEEPHIGESVAGAYGYGELFRDVGINGMNQSVIVVLYQAGQHQGHSE